ncbi:hypothetical protein Ahy_B01g051522 isoform C [Arachis hypogaea]|uniref:Uncharacterized protein n=2 Tax=Arachis TaxID=3817 RepID=A0A445AM27_ARAHY|nr:hypothetical protein Ahy_B01g051522 isoform C [Arachis hypogaea]
MEKKKRRFTFCADKKLVQLNKYKSIPWNWIIETNAPLAPSSSNNTMTMTIVPSLHFLLPQNPKPFQIPNFILKTHYAPFNFRPQFSRETNTPPSPTDRGLIFQEKVQYLKNLKVNPQKAFQVNPNLRSTPLSTVKSVEQCLSSMGIHRSAMGRILDMLPELLNRDPATDLYPILDFLLNDVGIPYPDVHKSISRCPRLLICSVEEQLKPTLKFLMKLGFTGSNSLTCQNTVLLVSSVEGTLIPKIEFLKSLGLSESEVNCMVVRSPALLTYSVEKNLKPKVEYFLNEMNGNVSELNRFPQYFSFSLEGRIKPRHKVLVENRVKLPLHLMLKGDDGVFYETLINTRLRKLDGR